MKRSSGRTACRRFTYLVADVLTGRLGVTAMVFGYSVCAIVLLAYVSTKVYTYSLMEDISASQRDQRVLKEDIGLLTQQYAELSAMRRITEICEEQLGMLPADASQMVRISFDADWAAVGAATSPGGDNNDFPANADRGIDEVTEVIRR